MNRLFSQYWLSCSFLRTKTILNFIGQTDNKKEKREKQKTNKKEEREIKGKNKAEEKESHKRKNKKYHSKSL